MTHLLLLLLATLWPAFAASARYELGPGDVLQVQVYGEKDLSGSYPVDDGGVLDFPLLGPVEVSGMTAAEVGDKLRELLADGYVNAPLVTTSLDGFKSQPVQVLGAVQKPGTYYLDGPTSVLDVLGEAGGVKLAGVDEIRVTHEGGEVERIGYEKLVASGAGDLRLRGGDVVFVPEQVVSVMGEVRTPGNVGYQEALTIASCIAAAGGVLPTANLRRVTILREGASTRVNLRRILRGKAEDVPVKPGDRVFVGESAF